MSETFAIHKYIADKWQPELLGKDAAQRAQVNMLSGVLKDVKEAITRPCYTQTDKTVVADAARNHLPKIVEWLGDKQFLTDSLTWLDFYFWEILELAKSCYDDLLTDFPVLGAYHQSVANLPRLKEYLDDPNHREANRSFNNKSA